MCVSNLRENLITSRPRSQRQGASDHLGRWLSHPLFFGKHNENQIFEFSKSSTCLRGKLLLLDHSLHICFTKSALLTTRIQGSFLRFLFGGFFVIAESISWILKLFSVATSLPLFLLTKRAARRLRIAISRSKRRHLMTSLMSWLSLCQGWGKQVSSSQKCNRATTIYLFWIKEILLDIISHKVVRWPPFYNWGFAGGIINLPAF